MVGLSFGVLAESQLVSLNLQREERAVSGEDAGRHPERPFLPANCPLGHRHCAGGGKVQFIGPMPPVLPVLRHVPSSSPHGERAQAEGMAGLEHLGMMPNPSQAPRPGVAVGPRHRTRLAQPGLLPLPWQRFTEGVGSPYGA